MIDAGWKDRETKMWTSKAKSSGVSSDAEFLANAEAQEIAMADYMRAVEGQLRAKGAISHVGKSYVGPDGQTVRVTNAGIAGAAHREGAGKTNETLAKLARRANGRPARFDQGNRNVISRMSKLSRQSYEFGQW